jgi:hypothetical protein
MNCCGVFSFSVVTEFSKILIFHTDNNLKDCVGFVPPKLFADVYIDKVFKTSLCTS